MGKKNTAILILVIFLAFFGVVATWLLHERRKDNTRQDFAAAQELKVKTDKLKLSKNGESKETISLNAYVENTSMSDSYIIAIVSVPWDHENIFHFSVKKGWKCIGQYIDEKNQKRICQYAYATESRDSDFCWAVASPDKTINIIDELMIADTEKDYSAYVKDFSIAAYSYSTDEYIPYDCYGEGIISTPSVKLRNDSEIVFESTDGFHSIGKKIL